MFVLLVYPRIRALLLFFCSTRNYCISSKIKEAFIHSKLFNTGMRFFLYVQIPTEAGNTIAQDPNLLRKIEDYINNVKAEAAYFGPSNGNRTMFFCCEYGYCRYDSKST
jgi:hypothetical protein